jgi:SNF2 family DNA or RNA helicase
MRFLLGQACGGLFADPGMGKTSITLAAFKELKRRKLARTALVIAPLRPCYLVWPKERAKWKDFGDLRMEILHGPQKVKALARKADIYVINPDGLQWLISMGQMNKFDTLVVDESTKFKHTRTKRFKLLKPYLDSFARRWILTGTPTPNGYLDLFGQIYILDLGAALGAYITHYKFNYFAPTGYGGYTWVLKEGSEEAIQAQIAPYTLRLEANEKDMPERIENVIRIELPEESRHIYDEMEEDMITLLAGGHEVQAKNAAAASTKCRQVANGGLFFRDIKYGKDGFPTFVGPRQWQNLHTEKVDAIGDLYEQLQGSPLMVTYDFEHDLDRLTHAFPKAAVMGGGTSMKESIAIEAAWNKGRIELMLVQPQAMGHGLNLQSGPGHTIALHSLMWDYEVYDQLIRRVWRTGQKSKHVFVHHIVARNTCDEAVLKALRAKRRGQDSLLAALRDYVRKRSPRSPNFRVPMPSESVGIR